MRITGPERYKLVFTSRNFTVTCPKGTNRFSGIATTKLPKLYVVSVAEKPIYVGVTRQPIQARLRYGWSAAGKGGYYGYKWRHKHSTANLDIWCQNDPKVTDYDMETIEAEVVFLIRCAGQWPPSQTEIHFHCSSHRHRKVAAEIVDQYGIKEQRRRK